MTHPAPLIRILLLGGALSALSACQSISEFDWDMRSPGKTLDTSQAARSATADRPAPDARGVISYPNYQVALANRGDTVATVANRVGTDAGELARYNALQPNDPLREGEVLALPRRVAEPVALASAIPPAAASPVGGIIGAAPSAAPTGGIDVTSIASSAIDRAAPAAKPAAAPAAAAKPAAPSPGPEPTRHKVARGETAFIIARAYNVSARALADWNGLDADMTVREGQYLMIPVAGAPAPAPTQTAAAKPTTAPGEGSPTPVPPSAAKPLPNEKTPPADKVAAADPAAAPAPGTPASPDLGAARSSSAKLGMPVSGKIIRGYEKKKNDGIDISASAGTAVAAAADGTVAAITQDTEGVPILVLRHADNLLTVYAGIDNLTVAKGASVKRGQSLGKVRAASPAFLHFEVRKGLESVDPMPYLQ
jgi:murein DD-endopeptidase MepM/ murein hydrolase activator NlpD